MKCEFLYNTYNIVYMPEGKKTFLNLHIHICLYICICRFKNDFFPCGICWFFMFGKNEGGLFQIKEWFVIAPQHIHFDYTRLVRFSGKTDAVRCPQMICDHNILQFTFWRNKIFLNAVALKRICKRCIYVLYALNKSIIYLPVIIYLQN